MADLIAIGRLGRPHGVRGQIRFWPFNPATELVRRGGVAQLGRPADLRSLVVRSVRRDAKSHVVAFEGIDDRDVVNELNGSMWFVRRDDFPEAGEDEIYVVDLIGATVRTVDGVALGVLADVQSAGDAELLVIRGERREHLVPNVEQFVVRLQADEIIIRPIDGLIEGLGDDPAE